MLFSFDLLKAKGRPQQRIAFGLVKSIEAPDDYTVRYDLSGAKDRELPLILALMPVLPKHATNVERFQDATLAPPIGSGPYKVADVKPGSRVVLKRDENYWGAELPSQRGFYNFDEIDLDYFRDGNALFEAFKAGLVDYRDEQSPTRWSEGYDFPARATAGSSRRRCRTTIPRGWRASPSTCAGDMFNDARLREALGMMFDFEWINANLFNGLYPRTKSFFDAIRTRLDRPPCERSGARSCSRLSRGPCAPTFWKEAGVRRSTTARGATARWPDAPSTLLTQAGYRLEGERLEKDGVPVAFEIMVKDRSG